MYRYQASTLIDQLTYNYASSGSAPNEVQSIADATGLSSGTMSYAWDPNGNLLSNTNTVNTAQNKSFTYNMLNLPQTVVTSTGGTDTPRCRKRPRLWPGC